MYGLVLKLRLESRLNLAVAGVVISLSSTTNMLTLNP